MSFSFNPPAKTVISVTDPAKTVIVQPENPVNVSIPTGLQGPKGDKGDQGDQGIPGVTGGSFTYVQGAPLQTWTIDHLLGYFPSVTIVDSSGAVVEGDVVYADADTLIITFSAAFSGKAFLS